MARRSSSFGLFGLLGRSHDLRELDRALRALDLHPRLVPEAVKLTAANLVKDHAGDHEPSQEAYHTAAEMVTYCMIGADAFARANGDPLAQQVERRIEAALRAGDSLDAQLILLTLEAGLTQPSVVQEFRLTSE